jgi:sulfonate transport system substrate-binding protein
MKMKWIAPLLAETLLAGALLAGPAGATETLRIGYQKGGGLLTLMKTQGTLEKQLAPQGYEVKWIEFPAGPQMLEALNAGSLDIATTGAPPPIFAQAAGVDLVYIGAEPGAGASEALFVPKKSPVRTVAQLKGKRVALQKGSGSHHLLVMALQRAGLSLSDITPVYMTPADARAAFMGGSVDAWVVWDPYLASAQDTLDVRVLADYRGLPEANGFYEASRAFVTRSPKIVSQVMAQVAKTCAWSTAHQDEIGKTIASQTGLSPKLVTVWQSRIRCDTKPVSSEVIANQQKVADLFFNLKLIPRKIDVSKNVWKWQP